MCILIKKKKGSDEKEGKEGGGWGVWDRIESYLLVKRVEIFAV